MTDPIRILLIEDNPGDALLIQEMLEEVRSCSLEWANCLASGLEALSRKPHDVVLLDLALPDSFGIDTFNRLHRAFPDIPVIILTSFDDDALAIHSVREGTQDYLLKGKIQTDLLVHAIRYAIERNKAEISRQKKQREIEAIFHSLQDFIFVTDPKGTILYSNHFATDRLQYPAGELTTMTLEDLHLPEHRLLISTALAGIREEGREYYEFPFVARDGTRIPVEVKITRGTWGDKDVLFAVGRDVTEQQQAEKLKEAHQQVLSIINSLPDAAFATDTHKTVIAWNRAMEDLTTCPGKTIIGKPVSSAGGTGVPFLVDFVLSAGTGDLPAVPGSTARDDHWYLEQQVPGAYGGKGAYLWAIATPLYGRDGTIGGAIQSIRDITLRKEIEQELQIRNHAIESSINSVILADLEGKITYGNQASVIQWGFLHSSDMIGASIDSLFRKGDEVPDLVATLRREGGYVGELVACRRSGGLFDINLAASVVKDEHQRPVCIILSCVDITRSKRYEDQLKASLAEKEIMLREIHHRTKNNMQIISSLLKLQSFQISDPTLQQVFQDCDSRIQSMSLVHENLLRSDDFGHLDIQEYIRSLTSDLLAAYIQDQDISFSIDVEDIPMSLDMAIPCGLILNELISNALKYAFLGKKSGSIAIGMHRLPENRITLTVRDNGQWQPEEIINRNALGLKMVDNLVKHQLEGTITFEHQEGTRVTIIFPEVAAP